MKTITIYNKRTIKYTDKPPKRVFGYVQFYSDKKGTLIIVPQAHIVVHKADLKRIIKWCSGRINELENNTGKQS